MTDERRATLGQLKGSISHRSCSRQTALKGKQHHTCLLLTSHPRLLLTHSVDFALMGRVFKCSNAAKSIQNSKFVFKGLWVCTEG